jgi:hypothetical protein
MVDSLTVASFKSSKKNQLLFKNTPKTKNLHNRMQPQKESSKNRAGVSQ